MKQQMGLLQDKADPHAKLKPVKVLSVSGSKGGIGKTNIAINLAIALAKQQQKVVLFDADLSMANVDVLLDLKAKKNLFHVFSGQCCLQDILLEGPAGITIVPAPSGIPKMTELTLAEYTSLIHIFSTLTQEIDFLIIDTAAGISNQSLNFLCASNEIILVINNEVTSISDACALIKILNVKYKLYRFKVLANMIRHEEEGKEAFYKLRNITDRSLDVTLHYIGAIPYDEYLRIAVKYQCAVIDEYPNAKSSTAFTLLAKNIIQWGPTYNDGRIAFFFERMLSSSSKEKIEDID